MTTIKNIDDFEKLIVQGKGLNIVRFCSVWSGPCHIMGPIYDTISGTYKTKASFYRVDIDDSPLVKMKYGIKVLPTFLFYKNAECIDFSTGLISRDFLVEKVENALKYVPSK